MRPVDHPRRDVLLEEHLRAVDQGLTDAERADAVRAEPRLHAAEDAALAPDQQRGEQQEVEEHRDAPGRGGPRTGRSARHPATSAVRRSASSSARHGHGHARGAVGTDAARGAGTSVEFAGARTTPGTTSWPTRAGRRSVLARRRRARPRRRRRCRARSASPAWSATYGSRAVASRSSAPRSIVAAVEQRAGRRPARGCRVRRRRSLRRSSASGLASAVRSRRHASGTAIGCGVARAPRRGDLGAQLLEVGEPEVLAEQRGQLLARSPSPPAPGRARRPRGRTAGCGPPSWSSLPARSWVPAAGSTTSANSADRVGRARGPGRRRA